MEVNSKKRSFWAGLVAGRRTIAILLRVEDKRIPETRRTPGSSSQCKKNRIKSISPWKKKDSPMEPRRKNKISNFGAIFLYTQTLHTTLSLSLSQFEERQKSRKDIYIRGLSNYYMFWHFESVYNCSKGIHVFLRYHVVYVVLCHSTTNLLLSHFLFSFYLSYVILLRIVLLIPLKYHTGNRSCRLLQYNIITTRTYRSIFFHSRGEGSLAAWWVCDSVKFGTPCQRRSVWL